MNNMQSLLFTGGTGFLGRNIMPLLKKDYVVTTCGISSDDLIKSNLSKEVPIFSTHYDVVLHAAGKAHVEKVGVPKSLIFISTVAVYGCDEGELIAENHSLNGTTPYAKSKIMAEEFLIDWCAKHNVILTILRPSLLAGVNPPGNLGDMIKGIKKGFYVNIAGGKVRKSILMAEDIANLVSIAKDKGGIYNVCDTDQPSFGEISVLIARQLGKRNPLSIPYWAAKSLALIGDVVGKRFPINSLRLSKLTQSLTFSNEKACQCLGWKPLKVLDNFRITNK